MAGPIGFFAFIAAGVWILILAVIMWRFEDTLPLEQAPASVPPTA